MPARFRGLLAWSVAMFAVGYIFGVIQQLQAFAMGHEAYGGAGTCLHIGECAEYMFRSECAEWMDA